MRYFYDFEFLEKGPLFPLVPISIGVVSEDGREYYAVNRQFDFEQATDWINENVVVHLPSAGSDEWKTPGQIATDLLAFVEGTTPEWWGYFASYDHVLLCQLFGDMNQLPAGWPYFTRDIEQLRLEVGAESLPPHDGVQHNSLEDARWTKRAWEYLRQFKQSPR